MQIINFDYLHSLYIIVKSKRWSISVLCSSLDNSQERHNRNSNFLFIFIFIYCGHLGGHAKAMQKRRFDVICVCPLIDHGQQSIKMHAHSSHAAHVIV